jgi:hypothetical protein
MSKRADTQERGDNAGDILVLLAAYIIYIMLLSPGSGSTTN